MGESFPGLTIPDPHGTLEPELPAGSPQVRMAALYARLADEVAEDDRPVVWAGDCVAVIGVLAGLERRGVRPAVVWFDAHGDFNTHETTRTGFLGGMPLAMITGRGERTIVAGAGLTPVEDSRIWLVGARDLDPGERDALDASGVRRLTVEEIPRLEPPAGPVHVHFDVDVVDPAEMPAVGIPAPGGPGTAAVAVALAHLARADVVSVSVSTWDPGRPGADRAAAAARRVLAPLLR